MFHFTFTFIWDYHVIDGTAKICFFKPVVLVVIYKWICVTSPCQSHRSHNADRDYYFLVLPSLTEEGNKSPPLPFKQTTKSESEIKPLKVQKCSPNIPFIPDNHEYLQGVLQIEQTDALVTNVTHCQAHTDSTSAKCRCARSMNHAFI